MKHIHLTFSLLILSVFAWQLFITSAYAQWSNDPNVNNVICDATLNQLYPKIVSDGSGGAIITWGDLRNGNTDANIYAQRINSSGVVQWTTNGVALSNITDYQYTPIIVSDGSSGAIITWMDFRNSNNPNIYAQKIDSSGDVQWTENGVAISTATGQEKFLTIVSDGSGGAIITWADGRQGGNHTDIYAQKVNSSGVVQWTVNGVAISTGVGVQATPTIESDGSGGAIITWDDERGGGSFGDIYAQKINSSGVVQWTANGVAISTAPGDQNTPTIVSDGSGGAIITWGDKRGGAYSDIYAQQVSANGNLGVVTGIAEEPGIAMGFALLQNYPNPFNPTTKIRFTLPDIARVTLRVYSVLGQEVATIVNGKELTKGLYEYEFDGRNLSSGIYIYKIIAGNFLQSKKMILLK